MSPSHIPSEYDSILDEVATAFDKTIHNSKILMINDLNIYMLHQILISIEFKFS